MFGHATVISNDIERSQRFYGALQCVVGADAPARSDVGNGHARFLYLPTRRRSVLRPRVIPTATSFAAFIGRCSAATP